MDVKTEISEKLADEWIPTIYRDQVRTQRTRSYRMDIPAKENKADIQHTLLGIELKVGKIRMACPDLSTARYLQVFARIGCTDVALPYDITKIPALADRLESSWQRSLLFLEEITTGKSPQMRGKLRSTLVKTLRNDITGIGAGDAMPAFDRPTRQRR